MEYTKKEIKAAAILMARSIEYVNQGYSQDEAMGKVLERDRMIVSKTLNNPAHFEAAKNHMADKVYNEINR